MSAELELLSRIRTRADAVAAFSDDGRCRRMLEAMVWPRGRVCPACGCHR
ncbi:transposase, partial [Asticcacaulis sp.]